MPLRNALVGGLTLLPVFLLRFLALLRLPGFLLPVFLLRLLAVLRLPVFLLRFLALLRLPVFLLRFLALLRLPVLIDHRRSPPALLLQWSLFLPPEIRHARVLTRLIDCLSALSLYRGGTRFFILPPLLLDLTLTLALALWAQLLWLLVDIRRGRWRLVAIVIARAHRQ